MRILKYDKYSKTQNFNNNKKKFHELEGKKRKQNSNKTRIYRYLNSNENGIRSSSLELEFKYNKEFKRLITEESKFQLKYKEIKD